ncbi:hypothetical protein [Deinococcus peraridilitoris]|uniref:Yip1 domain-containing protein n=1 Tax=Deinococcus peraridilitoris (strain DSM 19664 / LMG 22246 / CIP 109416 / KR-200) TaxID=937777 RepID=L0A042_DEIPD|nr:hypothetical protein [Deinococcus peraridilitoris]AFZ66819.1 Protein of unknown function (DUF1282) [Deinococcus peraridilitoris DSM 19664]
MRSSPFNPAEMVRQSIDVVSRPSVRRFEQYERSGGLTQAVLYVLLGAIVTGLINAVRAGFPGWIESTLVSLTGFLVFTAVVYAFGKRQGGTGSMDEVAYTFSLYWVPISVAVAVLGVIFGVLKIILIGYLLLGLLNLVRMLASVFFAYLAVQSSMNMRDPAKNILTLVVAAAVSWVAQLLVGLLV